MEEKIKEIYSNDTISLTDLVQKWIDENNQILYCNILDKGLKYKCR